MSPGGRQTTLRQEREQDRARRAAMSTDRRQWTRERAHLHSHHNALHSPITLITIAKISRGISQGFPVQNPDPLLLQQQNVSFSIHFGCTRGMHQSSNYE